MEERHYLAGRDHPIADIGLLMGIDFAKFVGMEMPKQFAFAWLACTRDRASERSRKSVCA